MTRSGRKYPSDSPMKVEDFMPKKIYTDRDTGRKLNQSDRLMRLATGSRKSREFKEERWKLLVKENQKVGEQIQALINQLKEMRDSVKSVMPDLDTDSMSAVESVAALTKSYKSMKELYDGEVESDVGSDEEM